MYLAIDIGGTKTLLGLFTAAGSLSQTQKFETPNNYEQFKQVLAAQVANLRLGEGLKVACCAVPGRIDRSSGTALGYGNLNWPPAHLKSDLEKILNTPLLVENDAKLAGLSEALAVLNHYKRVLYVTIGTGIGTALIVDGHIDKSMADSEGGQIWLDREGNRVAWEDAASGKAIKDRYGKLASELEDPTAWEAISTDMAEGLFDLIAMVQPEVVIIGGGVGAHFHKFGPLLENKLSMMGSSLVPIPPVVAAQRPEDAVLFGCFSYIKQNFHQ